MPKARPVWGHFLAPRRPGFSTFCSFSQFGKEPSQGLFFFFFLSGLQASL
ncbi:hypothetical protein EBI_27113 [Enterocytozoon bieneusi H348]|nr:hypothetical protein EBI_27113 [Enterocytozoon bieneusi H348]|eukprot:XP_002651250.1 hypothetical protein EBI_27113 [Enterocytozoon bieneusi H348]